MTKEKTSTKTLCVCVLNEHSVLARISGLFAGRGYNIESLSVAPLPNSEFSHITITTKGNPRVLEQIIKQLHKLIPVLSVTEHENLFQKEMVLVKLSANQNLSDIQTLCNIYNGTISEVNQKHIIITATDTPRRIESFISAIESYKPKEVVKSGTVAIER